MQKISGRNFNRCRWASAFFSNAPLQAKSMLHSQEQAAGGIGLRVNANKTDYMCFEWGPISTLSGRPLKSVDRFTYLSSNISSTESDINICLAKTWTAINHMWGEMDFLPICIHTTVWMHHTDTEKARWELHKDITSYLKQILEAAAHKTTIYLPFLKSLQ